MQIASHITLEFILETHSLSILNCSWQSGSVRKTYFAFYVSSSRFCTLPLKLHWNTIFCILFKSRFEGEGTGPELGRSVLWVCPLQTFLKKCSVGCTKIPFFSKHVGRCFGGKTVMFKLNKRHRCKWKKELSVCIIIFNKF